MKIIVFGMTENPGGIESVIMNYYRHIDRSVLQFDFLCNCSKIAYEDEIKEMGGKIYSITSRKESYTRFKAELDQFMKQHASEYAAIWVNVCSLVNIDYLISAKKYGIPKRIIHCHNASNDGGKAKRLIHELNKRRIERYATHFWSCAEDASPWFFNEKTMRNPRYSVICNAIDVKKYARDPAVREQYREELGLQDKIVIGHVGRFHFQKNHRFLIEVFEALSQRDDRYRLLLIGQGELENEVRKQVASKNLTDKVMFLGARMGIEKLYSAMDCFLFPSVFEGLGIVALEAQAAMLPCVIADTVPQVVKVNDNVVIMSLNESADKWADAIEAEIGHGEIENKFEQSEYNMAYQIQKFERRMIEE